MPADPLIALHGPIYRSLYFATVMSSGFYGLTCMQAFFYYMHYRDNPLRMKSFVAAVWVSNTIHDVLTISGTYKYMMADQENLLSVLSGIPEFILIFTVLAAIATQGFFVYRIYVFNGKNIFGPLIWIPLAIYQVVSVLLYVTKALYSSDGVHVVNFLVLDGPFFIDIISSSLCVAVAVDVLIAIILTFLLVRERTATGFSSTAHTLQRLIVFVVNSGIWTATFATLALFFLHFYPSNLFHVVFGFPLCSVYCNTLLANLNARAYIRGEAAAPNTDADPCKSLTSQALNSSRGDQPHGGSRVVSFRTSGGFSQSMLPGCPMTVVTFANVEGHGGVTLVGNRLTSTSENAYV